MRAETDSNAYYETERFSAARKAALAQAGNKQSRPWNQNYCETERNVDIASLVHDNQGTGLIP